MEGGSGVEVLFIWDIHCNLLLAFFFCCLKKVLVMALSSCYQTAWIVSCIVLCTMAISGRGDNIVLTDKLPDSGGDGLEVFLLVDSLLASWLE